MWNTQVARPAIIPKPRKAKLARAALAAARTRRGGARALPPARAMPRARAAPAAARRRAVPLGRSGSRALWPLRRSIEKE